MKKILLTVITVLLVVSCFCTFGAVSPAPSSTPSSDQPPMIFTVTANSGKNEVVLESDKDNTEAKPVTLTFSAKSRSNKFTEGFTVQKIVNTSTLAEYTDFTTATATTSDSLWEFEKAISIPLDKIGEHVTFELYYTKSSAPTKTLKVSAKVEIKAPNPSLKVEAEVESESIVPGSLVQIKYVVENVGNVPVKNILIEDPTVSGINGEETFTRDSYLSVGGTITKYIWVVLDGEITLAPSVSYIYNENIYTAEGKQVVVATEEVEPTVSLTCDSYIVSEKGAKHKFNYLIKNTSQITITNIKIYDSDSETANLVEEIPVLEIDQEITGSYEIPIEKSGFYKFKIVYSYEGADSDISKTYKTDKTLKLPNEVSVQIKKTSPENLKEAGELTFTLLIENSTLNELRDITISEENGLFSKITLNNIIVPAMKNGEAGTCEFDVKVNVPKDETVVLFSLKYKANGEFSTIALPHTVHFIKIVDTATPTPTPDNQINSNDNGERNKLLLTIILAALFMLIVLALIVILIILMMKKSSPKGTPTTVRRKVGVGFTEDNGYSDSYDDDYYDDEAEIEDLDESTLDEEYGKDASDEFDDDGVKIYKGKKH